MFFLTKKTQSFPFVPFVLGMTVLTSARTNMEEIGAQLLWRSGFSRRLSATIKQINGGAHQCIGSWRTVRKKKKKRIGRLVHLETDLALEAFLAVTVGRSSPPGPGTRIPVRSLEHGMLPTVAVEQERILSLSCLNKHEQIYHQTNRTMAEGFALLSHEFHMRVFLTSLPEVLIHFFRFVLQSVLWEIDVRMPHTKHLGILKGSLRRGLKNRVLDGDSFHC